MSRPAGTLLDIVIVRIGRTNTQGQEGSGEQGPNGTPMTKRLDIRGGATQGVLSGQAGGEGHAKWGKTPSGIPAESGPSGAGDNGNPVSASGLRTWYKSRSWEPEERTRGDGPHEQHCLSDAQESQIKNF